MQNIKSEQDSIRCLFVGQRESATVLFKDPFIDIIGSDDATTCHIALIVDDSKLNDDQINLIRIEKINNIIYLTSKSNRQL